MKLDKIDRKILAILDANSRMPSSQIAKRLKISRQVVDYRINQLVKNKVILHFVALIDPRYFVENIWHVYVKLQNLTDEVEKNMMNYLMKKKNIWWIVKCQGEWDLIFSSFGDHVFEFDEVMSDFRSKFHKNINEHQITSMITVDMFSRGYFVNKETKRKPYMYGTQREKIDKKDVAILRILATNARMPSTQIAEMTGLTARQVIYRIKELERKEAIRTYRLHLNSEKLDMDFYKVNFYTQDFTDKSEKAIIRWCEMNPYVLFYVKKISPWTFELELETKGFKHLNTILKDMRNKFGNVIKRTEIILMAEQFKGELNILG